MTPAEGPGVQRKLAGGVSTRKELGQIRRVAGADIAVDRVGKSGRAAVVVLSYPEMELLEKRMVEVPLTFPYIPGFLSFRKTSDVLAAFEKLREPRSYC